jgi:hypothetical protein
VARGGRSFRPRLEALEDRRLLNASAVLDAAGNTFRLNVDATGKLTETYLGQTTTLAAGVLRAHAYRDSDGGIGITVVYDLHNGTFAAYDYDHTGGHYLGNNVIDVDKAYDRAGRIQEDVTYTGPGGFVTVEYTSAGARVVPQGGFFYLLIHPFQDAWGALGEDVSYVTLGPSGFSTTLIEYDSAGAHYQGRDAVADRYYDPAGRGFLYDVTFKGGVAYEYTDQVVTPLGSSGLFLSAGLPSVVYASRSGCYCDANLGDPTVGHDDSANLQALIDAVPAGRPLTIVIDAPMKLGNVKLRSGITIQGLGGSSYGDSFPASGVIQAPNTDCVFRNFDWASNYNNGHPVTDYGTIADQDITARDLFINGNRGSGGVNNACGGNPDIRYVSGFDGYSNLSKLPISPLIFFGVRNLQLDNLWVYDPDTKSVTMGYVDNFHVDNITVVNPAAYAARNDPPAFTAQPGSPGEVKIASNCRDGVVENVSGYTSWALVSIISDDSNGLTAYYPIWYPGPITNVQVRGLQAGLTGGFFVRLWSGADPYPGPASLIDQVTVEDVTGTSCQGVIAIDGPAQTAGNHGTLVFRNFNVVLDAGTFPAQITSAEGTYFNLTFADMTVRLAGATKLLGWEESRPVLMWFNFDPSGSGRTTGPAHHLGADRLRHHLPGLRRYRPVRGAVQRRGALGRGLPPHPGAGRAAGPRRAHQLRQRPLRPQQPDPGQRTARQRRQRRPLRRRHADEPDQRGADAPQRGGQRLDRRVRRDPAATAGVREQHRLAGRDGQRWHHHVEADGRDRGRLTHRAARVTSGRCRASASRTGRCRSDPTPSGRGTASGSPRSGPLAPSAPSARGRSRRPCSAAAPTRRPGPWAGAGCPRPASLGRPARRGRCRCRRHRSAPG